MNGARCKPAKAVHVDDRLQMGRAQERMEVVVLALSPRRGPASEAQQLYRETRGQSGGA
ncbi:Heat shock protein 15 OS=Rhodanobacter lindaniclasticus OX=75310 GN=B1991_02880 PE=3 SV=1 [Rhodanobacter lindaniclasticus]